MGIPKSLIPYLQVLGTTFEIFMPSGIAILELEEDKNLKVCGDQPCLYDIHALGQVNGKGSLIISQNGIDRCF